MIPNSPNSEINSKGRSQYQLTQYQFTLPNAVDCTDTETDKKWVVHNSLCAGVYTAQRQTPKQIPVRFCVNLSGICLCVGQCKCTMKVHCRNVTDNLTRVSPHCLHVPPTPMHPGAVAPRQLHHQHRSQGKKCNRQLEIHFPLQLFNK